MTTKKEKKKKDEPVADKELEEASSEIDSMIASILEDDPGGAQATEEGEEAELQGPEVQDEVDMNIEKSPVSNTGTNKIKGATPFIGVMGGNPADLTKEQLEEIKEAREAKDAEQRRGGTKEPVTKERKPSRPQSAKEDPEKAARKDAGLIKSIAKAGGLRSPSSQPAAAGDPTLVIEYDGQGGLVLTLNGKNVEEIPPFRLAFPAPKGSPNPVSFDIIKKTKVL